MPRPARARAAARARDALRAALVQRHSPNRGACTIIIWAPVPAALTTALPPALTQAPLPARPPATAARAAAVPAPARRALRAIPARRFHAPAAPAAWRWQRAPRRCWPRRAASAGCAAVGRARAGVLTRLAASAGGDAGASLVYRQAWRRGRRAPQAACDAERETRCRMAALRSRPLLRVRRPEQLPVQATEYEVPAAGAAPNGANAPR